MMSRPAILFTAKIYPLICLFTMLAAELHASPVLIDSFKQVPKCKVIEAKLNDESVILSAVNMDERLVKVADAAGRDQQAQQDIDALQSRLSTWKPGNKLGKGTLPLGGGFYEVRGGAGRLVIHYYESNGIRYITIVGKSSKNVSGNEERMFRVLRSVYNMGNNPARNPK